MRGEELVYEPLVQVEENISIASASMGSSPGTDVTVTQSLGNLGVNMRQKSDGIYCEGRVFGRTLFSVEFLFLAKRLW